MMTSLQRSLRFTSLLAARWVTKGKIACRALAPELLQALGRLEQLRLLCQTAFKVRLEPVVRADWDLKSLKEFCEGILDMGCERHEWRTSLLKQHASRRSRVSVSATLFLFRKVIPKPMSARARRRNLSSYVDKMTAPSNPLDEDFKAFARREVHHIFKNGWDRSWDGFVKDFTLPTRSCLERGRSKGGPRGGDRGLARMEYLSFAAEGKDLALGRETVPMLIWTGGKWRLVTKFSSRRSYLSPLHRLIYARLSRCKWLLRGEATRDCFQDFVRKEGEVFVSGDYESATDNLNIELTELMLDSMRQTSSTIPFSVWDEARRCLRNVFPDGRVQARGQLMGSLLSFPLLCLANYLTFRFAIPRRSVPIKINGDDLVFRSTDAEKDRWFEVVGKSGLVVSRGKTLVTSGGFSVNSTFFLAHSEHVEECPVIRSTCLFGGVEDPNQVAGRLKGVYGGGGIAGEQIRSLALREMSKQIWRSQRSLRRGLGAKVSWRSIAWSGLKHREVFYNRLPIEFPLPLKKADWSQDAVPDGFQRIPQQYEGQGDDPEFYREMIECCWARGPRENGGKTDEYWDAVRERTFRYVPVCSERLAKLAGMSSREYEKYLSGIANTSRPKKMVWVRKRPVGELAFRSGGWLEDMKD